MISVSPAQDQSKSALRFGLSLDSDYGKTIRDLPVAWVSSTGCHRAYTNATDDAAGRAGVVPQRRLEQVEPNGVSRSPGSEVTYLGQRLHHLSEQSRAEVHQFAGHLGVQRTTVLRTEKLSPFA